jgi:hypothetical protein
MVTDDEISTVSRAWLSYTASQDEKDLWAVGAVDNWVNRGQLEVAWRLVLALCSEVDADDLKMIANIGAGPVENMITNFGDAALDLIESLVATNLTLLRAVAMVWAWDEPERERVDRLLAAHGQERL